MVSTLTVVLEVRAHLERLFADSVLVLVTPAETVAKMMAFSVVAARNSFTFKDVERRP